MRRSSTRLPEHKSELSFADLQDRLAVQHLLCTPACRRRRSPTRDGLRWRRRSIRRTATISITSIAGTAPRVRQDARRTPSQRRALPAVEGRLSNGERERRRHGPLELSEVLHIETKDGAALPFEVVGILEDPATERSYAVLLHEPEERTRASSSLPIFDGNLLEDEGLAQEISTTSSCPRRETARRERANSRSFLSASVGVGHLSAANAVGGGAARDRSGRANTGRRFVQVCRARRFARRLRRLSADGQDDSADVPLHLRSCGARDRGGARFARGRISSPRAICAR